MTALHALPADAHYIQERSYMFGVESFYDGQCARSYDPYVHAARLGIPVATNDRLPDPLMVAAYSKRRGAIYLRSGLSEAVERCALAHEIVHYENGDVGCTRTQERLADRKSARRLVRRSQVEMLLEETHDIGAIALELRVTEHIMRTWVQYFG